MIGADDPFIHENTNQSAVIPSTTSPLSALIVPIALIGGGLLLLKVMFGKKKR